ncbi:hypothetical protein [Marinobacter nauticus]|uniref:hypothetical protein n=1 Tax=Marinobacter nauticus TaxID=2743 RepID=UPI0035197151
MFIRRNQSGRVVAVSEEPLAGFVEAPDDDPSVEAFLYSRADVDADVRFRASDSSLIRVIEDLVDLLAMKGVIRFTDLPSEAQAKLMERKSMRGQDDHLNLIDNSGDDLFDID